MNNFQYLCIRKTSSVYESLDRHRQAGTPARGFQEPPGAARPPQPSHRQTAGNRQMDACCHTRHRHTSIIPHHRRILNHFHISYSLILALFLTRFCLYPVQIATAPHAHCTIDAVAPVLALFTVPMHSFFAFLKCRPAGEIDIIQYMHYYSTYDMAGRLAGCGRAYMLCIRITLIISRQFLAPTFFLMLQSCTFTV